MCEVVVMLVMLCVLFDCVWVVVLCIMLVVGCSWFVIMLYLWYFE